MFERYVKNKLGDALCLAKWTNSTMHLGIGKNHSCHHPVPHLIPVQEVQEDPSALHNSKYKKEQRQKMLSGERPTECDYCWSLEDKNKCSDRAIMSKKFGSWSHFKDIVTTDHYDPTMLEVSFSNACNLKCAYCGPQFSSSWASEIESNGPYPTSQRYNQIHVKQIPDKEENPYIDAFWKYLPTMYDQLHTLRITGGEPMVSQRHTEKLLNYIAEHPNKKLTLMINSNLSVPGPLLEKFVELLKRVQPHVKRIEIATSNESHGAQAEYIRDGLDYNQWLDNCEYVLTRLPKLRLSLMCAYSVLSITSFDRFLDDIVDLKKKYRRVFLSVTYVSHPDFLHVSLAPKQWRYKLVNTRAKLKKNFNSETVKRFDFVLNEFDKEATPAQLEDLRTFVNEYDKRRNKKFLDVFSEYQFVVR